MNTNLGRVIDRLEAAETELALAQRAYLEGFGWRQRDDALWCRNGSSMAIEETTAVAITRDLLEEPLARAAGEDGV